MKKVSSAAVIKRILLGKPLRSDSLSSEKLSRIWGLPIMASDAVSSVAYAIEEILMVLVPVLGLAAVHYLGLVALPIILLLLILIFSYSQIIQHYPNGGGAYVVSQESLGERASLVAASALIIDYTLTVAVSISSSTAALIAAFPALEKYKILISLLSLLLITAINLRGASESSKIFGIPTYAFILIMGILIVTGLVQLISGTLTPIKYDTAIVATEQAMGGMMALVFLRAFSSGCSALTGVEAVSNAVPSFKEPAQKNAKHVLYMLGVIIIFIFGGSVLLASGLQVVPLTGHTVISQMGNAIFGNSILFYILQFTTSLILLLAANTAYTGLPNLLAILAKDGYMPRQFSQRGARLSFSNGIIFILIAAGILLVIFRADTHRIIPLYSVGVFVSFTLSQFGMFTKWHREGEKGWRHKSIINGVGALVTAVGAVIVFVTKFSGGSWILAIVIPIICVLMSYIKKHYDFVGRQLVVEDFHAIYKEKSSTSNKPCVVLASSLSRSVVKALNYANSISANVTALHISTDPDSAARLKKQWDDLQIDIPLVIIDSPYRDIIVSLEEYIYEREADLKPGQDLTVVMIKFVEEHLHDTVLHNQTTYFIERKLRHHKNVVTVVIPYIYKLN